MDFQLTACGGWVRMFLESQEEFVRLPDLDKPSFFFEILDG
jgi:hypothetical protein